MPSRRWGLLLLAGALTACRPATSTASPRYIERYTPAARAAGATASTRLPLVVAIHGLGADPEDMLSLLTGIRVPARLVMPQGIYPRPSGGFSWFATELRAGHPRIDARQVAGATDRLAALLRSLGPRTSGRPVVLGFSQGGVLSYTLAARHPDLVGLAIPIAGYLPEALATRPRVTTLPVIHAWHGTADPIVSISLARDTPPALRAQGYDVTLTEMPGVGHTVPAAMRAQITALVNRQLAVVTTEIDN